MWVPLARVAEVGRVYGVGAGSIKFRWNVRDPEDRAKWRARPVRAGFAPSESITIGPPQAGVRVTIGPGYLPKDTLGTSPQPSQDIGASTYRVAGFFSSSKLSSTVR